VTYMLLLKCALKSVEEIILLYVVSRIFTFPLHWSCTLFLPIFLAHSSNSLSLFVRTPFYPIFISAQLVGKQPYNQSRQGSQYNPNRPPRTNSSVILFSCNASAKLYFQSVTALFLSNPYRFLQPK